ncbi:hypothetical protein B0I35DRAFT_477001 [Stachybotrys elegans]|uniref:Uncharacterized protein n=1 Tax=Stachybotrys elegans TaxID=80388 RepID=A0A8K0T1N6_9HYPO|nr:hypothetical protein B0I35DRAFT_477001 [Stachybotrys elegans]
MMPTDLEKNGIYIKEGLVEASSLPPHIISLCEAVLDFHGTVLERLGVSKDDEFDGINNTLSHLDDEECILVWEYIQSLKEMKTKATKLSMGKDREREWEYFFRDHFFCPLANSVAISDRDTRYSSRTKFYYDYFEHAQSRPWSLFGSHQKFHHAHRLHLTEPRPDWVAFYPIYNLDVGEAADGIPTTERWQWERSSQGSIVENFSLRTLAHLSRYGLHATTTGTFREGGNKAIDSSDYICFPWFIVEHKKTDQAAETECYCQAANAGAATLMMLQTLAKYAERRNEDAHIPPVVTMTTVGQTVRIWVTYSVDKMSKTKMDCIWVGNITTMVAMIQFHAILENLHTWAMRVLRPWISFYIDQWKHRFPLHHEVATVSDDNAEAQVGKFEHDVPTAVSSSDVSGAEDDGESQQRQTAGNSNTFSLEDIVRKEFGLLKTHIDQALKENARSEAPKRDHVEYRSIGVQTTSKDFSNEDERKRTDHKAKHSYTTSLAERVSAS